MRIFRYIVLAFIIWTIPTFLFKISGDSMGSLSSYLMFGLLSVYYFINEKGKPAFGFLILGFAYYLFSGWSYTGDFDDYVFNFLKYIVMIIAGIEVARQITFKELYIFTLIGGLSVIVNATFFPDIYGRYGGFYLNPNTAALIAVIGYCMSFEVKEKSLRLVGFFLFSFAGLITFSRYFLVMWLVISLVAMIINRKNAVVFGVGFISIFLIFAVSAVLQLNVYRFAALEDIINNQLDRGLLIFQQNTRTAVWSKYNDLIREKLLQGNGFTSFSTTDFGRTGVHNTFLLTLGEAGIVAFIIMVFIYFRMLYNCLLNIGWSLYTGLLVLALISYMFVSHNFYDNYVFIFFSLFLYVQYKENMNAIEFPKFVLS